VLLCYIAHSADSIADFDTTQFYMTHAWAVGITELVKRLVLGPVLLLIGLTTSAKKKCE
jgi:hypothetical protein